MTDDIQTGLGDCLSEMLQEGLKYVVLDKIIASLVSVSPVQEKNDLTTI